MKSAFAICLSMFITVIFGGHLTADFEYQHDDGASDSSVGNPSTTFSWGNMFAVNSSGSKLFKISIGFGVDDFLTGGDGSLVGEPIEWRIWNDS